MTPTCVFMTFDRHPDPTLGAVPRSCRGAGRGWEDDTNESKKEVMPMGHSRSEPSILAVTGFTGQAPT